MRSMTGYGRGTVEQGRVRATVDVRAVNHRYLDLKLRGSPLSPAIEDAIGARVRAACERGALVVAVRLDRTDAAAPHLDVAVARASHAALAELARTLGTPGPDLALVLAQPGVLGAPDDDGREAEAPVVLAALEAALRQLAEMRGAEGEALARELAIRLGELDALRSRIAQLAAGVPELVQRRLHDRLARLLRDETDQKQQDSAGFLDPARLAQEVALLADRADVTEELVRLASHLHQARTLCGEAAPVGRRLEFLAQELGRELNTIASKSALAEISAAVVEAKAVLEKLREQVQNVE